MHRTLDGIGETDGLHDTGVLIVGACGHVRALVGITERGGRGCGEQVLFDALPDTSVEILHDEVFGRIGFAGHRGVELHGRAGFEPLHGQGVEPVVALDHRRDGGLVGADRAGEFPSGIGLAAHDGDVTRIARGGREHVRHAPRGVVLSDSRCREDPLAREGRACRFLRDRYGRRLRQVRGGEGNCCGPRLGLRVHVGRDADLLDVGAFRARCERYVVQVGDLHPFAAARAYGPVVVGGREAHDGGVGSQGVQSDRSGSDAESRLGGSGRSGRVVEDVLPRDVDSRSAVGPEVVHVVVGIDSDHDVIAVVVGSHVALRDAVAEYGGLVALPEEAAFVFVVVTVGDDAAVVLASHELVVVVVHEAHDAAAAPFVLADHVAAVHDLGEFGACARDAGDVADAGAACGGELVEIVAVVGAVGQVGVAVGCRDDA